MPMEELVLKKKDKTQIKGRRWLIANSVASFVIVTGMEEHSLRYDALATFLNAKGYDVYCLDHYGQGLNAKTEADLGIWPKSAFRITVNTFDELIYTKALRSKPVILFGHSLGSFIVQDYIQRYSGHVDKAIICGSNGPDFMLKLGYMLAKILVKDTDYNIKKDIFNKMSFETYNKSVKDPKTEFDWLSYSEENVKKYIADPYCGYGSTAGMWREFLKGMNRLYKDKFMVKIRKDIPILIIAGEEDPVGHSGKGPAKLEKLYSKKYQLSKVELKLYPKMRHEILNEVEHETVYKDILTFITK